MARLERSNCASCLWPCARITSSQMLARSIPSFQNFEKPIGLIVTPPPMTDERKACQRGEVLCPKSTMVEKGLEPRFPTFSSNAFIHKKPFYFQRQWTNGDRKLVFVERILCQPRCPASSHMCSSQLSPQPCQTPVLPSPPFSNGQWRLKGAR